MKSMTGYGFLEKSTDQFSFSVEIKSLNSKYMEIYINVPKVIRNYENELHSILKKYFERGKIELNIEIFDWINTKPIALNKELITRYFNELTYIAKKLRTDNIKLDSILKLDGITHRERTVISQKTQKEIIKAMEQTIKKNLEMRQKEGKAIKKDLLKLVSDIAQNVVIIKKKTKNMVIEKSEQLKKRIETIAKKSLDDNRLYSELAILVDKLDINEEVIRLNDHIVKFRSIASDNDQIGRKLDFLAQEMFREINTIASKSNNSEISHIVVELKNNVDKIREHCRNIV